MSRRPPPQVWAVMDEAVLRRPIGRATVMRAPAWPPRGGGAVYLDQRPDVEHYLEVADQFSGEAPTPGDTIGFIEQVTAET